VRIGGAYEFQPKGPSGDGRPEKSPKPQRADKGIDADGAVVSLDIEPLIRKAAAVEEVNVTAVNEARKLLRAGLLDTPEAVMGAAEAILSKGL